MNKLFDFSIGKKIGTGYLAMAALLLISGGAGYLATQQLANSLSYIAGPVNVTATAVSNGIRGVQSQMIAVDMALRSSLDQAADDLAAGKQLTTDAFAQISDAGMVSQQQLADLQKTLEHFDASREALLALDAEVRKLRGAMDQATANGKELLHSAEELASQKLVNAEWNVNRSEDNDSDVRDSEEWSIVSSSTDARLALLTRLANLELLLKTPADATLQETADANFEDLKLYLELIAETELLSQREVGEGHYAAQTFSAAVIDIVTLHGQLSAKLLERHAALEQARQDYRLAADQLMSQAAAFESMSQAAVQEQLASVGGATRSAQFTLAGLLIVGLLIAAGFYWLNMRLIARPIGKLAERLQDIAEGEGDLTVTLDARGRDEVAAVSRSFNQFTGKIRATLGEVRNAVDHLAGSSTRLQEVTASNIERMQAQHDDTAQVAATMQTMAHNMDSVAVSTEGALNSANQANDQAASGQAQVGSTMDSIRELAEQVEQASEAINQLAAESDAIGGVLDVIGGIAEQTNLLALNAAIEAARAGEQGRGFAVVADEVRTLASRTQQSTAEIQAMIERLQTGARKAAQVMDNSRNCAQTTVEQGGATGATFGEIVHSAASIQGMNQQIAQAVEEQRVNTDEASRSIASISKAGDEIVSGSSEIGEASRSLIQLSQQLQGIVQQFRI